MTLAAGSRLGPYEILSPLGAGGMGEVYRARDPRLGREVAIKVLPASFSADPDRLRRFEQEARAAGILNHPNITAVYDIGTHDGAPYVVQELLEGETLRSRLAGGAFTPRKALGHALQIANGLAAAHEKGIVHRDLKPENVFVTSDGRVKLLDFGLAKLTETPGSTGGTNLPTAAPATEPGMVLGTLGYMSPEQVRGKPADARSDIFSFGAILYEMLSGRRAFHGDSAADTMSAILLKEPVELSTSNRDVSPGLERVVHHCLEKNPEQRFQSARDLAFDLESLSDVSGLSQTRRASADGVPLLPRMPLLAALAVAAAVGVGIFLWARSHSGRRPVDSIAVLPFANATHDPNADYLGDGITESIINSLSRLPELRVAARSTALHYKGRDDDPQKVGKELNVRAVVSGKVLQRGNTLSIQADLVDTSSGAQLWGDHYERKASDILAVQEEIAREISEKLRLRLTGEDKAKLKKRDTENTEAYHLYMKGRYAWDKRTEDSLRESIEDFQRAIDKDPGYALAYAGLADTYAVMPSYSMISPGEAYPKARAAARKALEIDEGLAPAHATLGISLNTYDRDWAGSEAEFKKSIALDPGYATGRHWYALLLMNQGRFAEAEDEMRRAVEADPFSGVIQSNFCRLLILSRQYDRAIEQGRKAVATAPASQVPRNFLGQAYAAKKQDAQAISEWQEAAKLAGRSPLGLMFLGRVQALEGHRAEALQTIEDMKALSAQRYVSPAFLAYVFTMLGEKNQTLDWLEKGVEDRSFDVLFLNSDPNFDWLRQEPRFQDILRRIGLPTLH